MTKPPLIGVSTSEVRRPEDHMARRAVARKVPVLAICRGMQVPLARTLHQHLPDLGLDVEHRRLVPGETARHDVELVRGSRLAELAGGARIEVNSFHHQGLADLGRGVRVTGRSGDGMVEAVEVGAGFAVGVQWHAELLVDRPEGLALFEALVRAAEAHGRDPARAA